MSAWREHLAIVVLAAVLAAIAGVLSARAEMGDNFPPQHHAWLHEQTSPTGVHCCDPADCWLVQYRIAPPAAAELSGYRAFFRNAWLDIPARAVVRDFNPTGSAVLCVSPTLHVWCFFPEVEG